MFTLSYYENDTPKSDMYPELDQAIAEMSKLVGSTPEIVSQFVSVQQKLEVHTNNHGIVKITCL